MTPCPGCTAGWPKTAAGFHADIETATALMGCTTTRPTGHQAGCWYADHPEGHSAECDKAAKHKSWECLCPKCSCTTDRKERRMTTEFQRTKIEKVLTLSSYEGSHHKVEGWLENDGKASFAESLSPLHFMIRAFAHRPLGTKIRVTMEEVT